MTAELITAVVGAIISVLLEVVPGLKDVWGTLRWKPLIMLGISVLVGAGMWALVCLAGIDIGTVVDCSKQGVVGALYFGLISFMANQATYAVGARRING